MFRFAYPWALAIAAIVAPWIADLGSGAITVPSLAQPLAILIATVLSQGGLWALVFMLKFMSPNMSPQPSPSQSLYPLPYPGPPQGPPPHHAEAEADAPINAATAATLTIVFMSNLQSLLTQLVC